jgi:uncharacterized membrane protein
MRYPSIDILRMLAIFVMVFVHFAENLSGEHLPITGLGAPLFAMLSGVSYRLWASGQEARGKSEEDIFKVSVRRGLFVFGVGFAFNILVWLPEDTFNWDVLTFIGAALLLLNFARRLPLSISLLMAVMALVVSPFLRALAEYQTYWELGYFDPDMTLSDLVIGFLATGYFPFCPWIAYSLAGFIMASLLFREVDAADPDDVPLSPWRVVLAGGGLMLTSLLLLKIHSYLPPQLSKHVLTGWTMFPPTIEYVLGTIGMSLVLFGLAHHWVDRNPQAIQQPRWLDVAKTFSRYSLTIYVLHHIVHIWPLWIYGLAMGQEATYYWQKAMPTSAALVLASVFLAVCYFTFRSMGSEERHGIESWMRWLCD